MGKQRKPPDPIKVIKTSLKSICLESNTIQTINDYCKNLNQIIIHSTLFLKLFLLHKYHTTNTLPNIDKTFIEHIIKTISQGKKCGRQRAKCELDEFYETHYKSLIKSDKLSYSKYGNTIGYASQSILTCIENNIKNHFVKHLTRFVNIQFEYLYKDDNNKKQEVRSNVKKLVNDLLFNETKSTNEYGLWRDENKQHLIPQEINKNIHYDLKCNPLQYLPHLMYMNIQLEKQEKQLFQVIPLRKSLIPKYMLMDTKTLIQMLVNTKELGISQTKMVQKVNEYKSQIWNNVFNMDKIHKLMNKEKYSFHHMISTDGIGCSLFFIRNDLIDKKYIPQNKDNNECEFQYITELDKQELKQLKDYNYVGLDPGKNNLLFMIDESGNTFRYTKMQRRIETNQKKQRKVILNEIQKNNVKEIEQPLSDTCCKSCDIDKFKNYIQVRIEVNKKLLNFYEKEIFRKLRWRNYTETQRSESILINKIKRIFGKKIVIGYGSFQEKQQMKHSSSTPNIGMKRLLNQHFKVYTIDEFRTSKTCCNCLNNDTCYYKKRENPKPFRDGEVNVHGLLNCKNCSKSCHLHLINRDINGSKNILHLLTNHINKRRRPYIFCRGKKSFHNS